MYKSPIEIIQGQLKMEMENNIIRAVQQQDIVVDKHELLRALQYDRGQYDKGYRDGVESVQKQGLWRKVNDDLGIDRGWICSICNGSVYEMTYEPYQYCPHCGANMKAWEDNGQ